MEIGSIVSSIVANLLVDTGKIAIKQAHMLSQEELLKHDLEKFLEEQILFDRFKRCSDE